MALSNFDSLWRGILLRCPAAPVFLARQFVSFAFREVAEKRRWSWLIRRGQWLLNAVVKAGTVTVTRGSDAVVGVGTAFDAAHVGRQFRVSSLTPLYTISAVTDGLNLTLDQVWGGATTAGVGYEIYNAYVTAPTDFHALTSVYDPQFNWQLWLNVMQEELNSMDAQRAQSGTAWVVASYAYDTVSDPPLPRFEIWPHQKANYVYPFLYEARATDLEDASATLPRYIRGDVLLEGALAQAARWPGPSFDNPNPYFSLALANQHEGRFREGVAEMERQDDEVFERDVQYQAMNYPFAPMPWGDSSWLQRHSLW